MPTSTFENLPADKRLRLMRAATAEFARTEFAGAKLDRIAAAAGVPKGSLYQYFADKEAFYVHTVREALLEAWAFFERHLERHPPGDCFELLVEALAHLVDLQRERPELATLYARVVFAKDSQSRDVLYPVDRERSDAFYGRLIPWGREQGLLDPALPDSVVRFHMNAVGLHFQQLVFAGEMPAWLRDVGPLRSFAEQLVATLRRALEAQGVTS